MTGSVPAPGDKVHRLGNRGILATAVVSGGIPDSELSRDSVDGMTLDGGGVH